MTLFDGVFLLAVLGCVVALGAVCYALARRRWKLARRTLLILGSFLVLYTIVLLSVALLSPQRVLAGNQTRCFDDWCLGVERVVQQPAIGAVEARHGSFYLVTVRILSQARGITQRALDVQVYLLDAGGRRTDPDPVGQRALDASGQGGQSLNSELAPGGSFARTIVFDPPVGSAHLALAVSHGFFPEVLVIGSEQSFLHKPTIIQLQTQP